MKNILSLVKVLMKNSEMPTPKKGTKGALYRSLGIIAVGCILIPCCLIVGFVSYIMTQALIAANAPASGLLAELHIISAFSVVFGVLVIFNIMFFSSDREHLVPLPFRSHEILAAKFTYAYLAESMMEFLILLSMFVGFFLAYGWSLVSFLAAVIGIFVVPLLPLTYCAIISLLILGCMRKVKNGRIFHHISTILLIIFVLLFLVSFKDMGGITVENYVNSLASDTNLFSQILNKIFFTVPLLMDAVANNSILSLLLFLLGNAGAVAIMLLLGRFLYQPGLYTVGALGSGKKNIREDTKLSVPHGIFASYIKKEYLVLLRTKAYSGNCFYINLLWPFGLCLFLFLNREKEGLAHVRNLYQTGNERSILFLTMGVILLSFIATAMNSLASTAFTREGAHLSLVKYIPVPYRMQMYAKAFISLSITYPPLLLCVIIAGIYLNMHPVWYVYYALIILLCVTITTVIGMALDSAHPHSTWDDEYSALRGNLNTFFDMAVVMVISVLICAAAFLCYHFFAPPLLVLHVILAILMLVATVFSVLFGQNMVIKNMCDM